MEYFSITTVLVPPRKISFSYSVKCDTDEESEIIREQKRVNVIRLIQKIGTATGS